MLVYLDITTWRGRSLGAIHYYGTIKAEGKEPVELARKVTSIVAEELKAQDGNESSIYQVGSTTIRWLSKAALRRAAIRYFKKHYPVDGALLIEGHSWMVEPQPILCGKPDIKKAINRLSRQAEKCDYWSDEETMQRICDEWEELIKPFKEEQKAKTA